LKPAEVSQGQAGPRWYRFLTVFRAQRFASTVHCKPPREVTLRPAFPSRVSHTPVQHRRQTFRAVVAFHQATASPFRICAREPVSGRAGDMLRSDPFTKNSKTLRPVGSLSSMKPRASVFKGPNATAALHRNRGTCLTAAPSQANCQSGILHDNYPYAVGAHSIYRGCSGCHQQLALPFSMDVVRPLSLRTTRLCVGAPLLPSLLCRKPGGKTWFVAR
jgi:hypothetical protein